ncbi:MAG: V-type ATP synthase subunit B [Burkholderiales bacterium]|jgi:V/A-type H+-transporting ATPase subunit B|nr:V-type ATP synthase subunit B [Burkholderiales bacterium]
MREKEFRTASAARGGLLFMRNVPGCALGDRVVVRDHRGRKRNGLVIRTSHSVVLVEVFEGTDDLDLERTWVRFLDEPFELPLSRELLGRVFNGVGQPRDGRPPLVAGLKRAVNGSPVNPAARAYPREFIQTGVSAIDGMNSLVRGQKLPVFSGSGLPHNRLAAQIVRQAKLPGEEGSFAVVFGAMGVSHADARFFQDDFESSGVLGEVVMFTNLADDPPIERLILPRTALTAAEYLAFDLDMHVLVVLTDMTNYAEALREIATAKGDVPSRKGYPGYLYSDLAEIYERAGRIKERRGSITMIPVVTMPSDDITHPVPDLTGYITEGQIVLARDLAARHVYPPVAVLPSLSRLMKDGIGRNYTRDDHPHVANQLFAAYAQALEVRNLAAIIGAEELSEADRRYLAFADAFEARFVNQGENEDRSIFDTLALAWDVLSVLPPDALTRVTEDELARHHRFGASRKELAA